MEALALTDRDGLYGIPRFFEAAAGAGVSPVVGVEISVAEPGNPGGHLVLLADGMAGYRSLCRLITRYRCGSEDRRNPSVRSRYYWSTRRARLPHGRGSVRVRAASGALRARRRADRALRELREAFGEDLYVELTDDRTAGSRRRMGRVAELARRHGLPVLATNEVAYLGPEDHKLHDVVATSNLRVSPAPATGQQTSSTSSRRNRWRSCSAIALRPWVTRQRWPSAAPGR